MKLAIALLLLPFLQVHTQMHLSAADDILGKWQNLDKNLIVEIYKEGNCYKGRLLWFKNSNEKDNPSNTWLDVNNPDPALRTRKILGMDVLQKLVYNSKNNCWDGGEIYDSTTGRTWNSSLRFSSDGTLDVRGFWHFEFIGKTMSFKKYNPSNL
jgi:uncharacterized protein (DUF2147 family)